MIFAQMLKIVALSDLASMLCARKFSFAPQGDLPPKNTPFLAKMVLLSLYPQNRALDFDDFCAYVEIVALSDLASVMCAGKFSLPPGGDLPPNMAPFS